MFTNCSVKLWSHKLHSTCVILQLSPVYHTYFFSALNSKNQYWESSSHTLCTKILQANPHLHMQHEVKIHSDHCLLDCDYV